VKQTPDIPCSRILEIKLKAHGDWGSSGLILIGRLLVKPLILHFCSIPRQTPI
jgi:hypothetical protein